MNHIHLLAVLVAYLFFCAVLRIAALCTCNINKKRIPLSAKRGADAVLSVLDAHGYHYVRIEKSSMVVRPYYDKRTNVVMVPSYLYNEKSLRAAAVCARAAGAAITFIEDNVAYLLRSISKKLLLILTLLFAISIGISFFADVFAFLVFSFFAFIFANILYIATLIVEAAINRRASISLSLSKDYTKKEQKTIKRLLRALIFN